MALQLAQVVKRYIGPDGSVVPVIDIESLSVGDGEQVALIGSSGSGKTTLLHMIAGILTPDSGRILFTQLRASVTRKAPPARAPGFSIFHPFSKFWINGVTEYLKTGDRLFGHESQKPQPTAQFR